MHSHRMSMLMIICGSSVPFEKNLAQIPSHGTRHYETGTAAGTGHADYRSTLHNHSTTSLGVLANGGDSVSADMTKSAQQHLRRFGEKLNCKPRDNPGCLGYPQALTPAPVRSSWLKHRACVGDEIKHAARSGQDKTRQDR
ncbi:hypothetical protein SARC_02535 [Sphaeroforma arctica JP610]|uniref:Uncharacterized protein n=1 Tax=Sphaeroforma arctica JP610 TaxID=667725 RepID=A0A0L0G8R8_9EUKA|nr:hypothetical protein SARC_02535 [Sphaeroforma arctica JP610]KNC85276.1 hypothetical protein SARC_02535 [Sphaeroforma arctica JP610]|eukprot:XP_014159178.1 hypothetical protein SARC_02535 [Sphaeroforma arctica JP610]